MITRKPYAGTNRVDAYQISVTILATHEKILTAILKFYYNRLQYN
ncbi:hypothetical protein MNBD_GAMMA01-2053 [hydrothermal vent metagenome]|uniref:Uncharacterized protein n=1 Tax=hydrothermal vent metagenome TaxID=652676 RepID=A0A3B0VCJ8_9ZZZZ